MKSFVNMKAISIGALNIFFCLSLSAQSIALDNESSRVDFEIKNFGVWIDGDITGMKVSGNFDPNDLANSQLTASVEVSTLKTGIKKRDANLQEEEYFHVDKYPTMDIVSSTIIKSGASYVLNGTLTMKGNTKNVEIPFSVTENAGKKTLMGNFSLNRLQYGVGEKGLIMGNTVKVRITCVMK